MGDSAVCIIVIAGAKRLNNERIPARWWALWNCAQPERKMTIRSGSSLPIRELNLVSDLLRSTADLADAAHMGTIQVAASACSTFCHNDAFLTTHSSKIRS